MKKSNTTIGKQFELLVNKNKNEYINKFESFLNKKCINIIDINCNNYNVYKELRKEYRDKYVYKNKDQLIFPNIDFRSSIRGDYLLKTENKNIILDCKTYDEIQSRFKFPDDFQDKKLWFKSCDSNIKYILNFLNKNIEYYENSEFIFEKFIKNQQNKNFNFSLSTNKEIEIGTIETEYFLNILKSTELGFSYYESEINLDNKKIFITKNDSKYLLDFDNITKYNKIVISIFISSKNYYYISFKDKEQYLYIVSQRKDFSNNCAFLNNRLRVLI